MPSECNPETFYIGKVMTPQIVVTIQDVESFINQITVIFFFAFSPFLIITPFCVDKLSTVNRKIIAMITLSDCVSLILTLIMNAREDKYMDAKGYWFFECTIITMVQNIAPTWSILWSFTLLATIWVALVSKAKYNQNSIFIRANFIVWPVGIAITLMSSYSYLYPFDMRYNGNYLASKGCQPNFTFLVTDDGINCLVDEKGRNSLVTFYSSVFIILIATNIMFVLIFYQTFTVWRQLHLQAQSPTSSTIGYIVAARHSKETLKNSAKFSLTGFIYIVAWLPLFIRQFVTIYVGPRYVYESIFIISQTIYMLTIGNLIAIMNVLFYGLLSEVFRTEMVRIAKRLPQKSTVLTRSFQTKIASLSHSNRYGTFPTVETSLTTDYETDSD